MTWEIGQQALQPEGCEKVPDSTGRTPGLLVSVRSFAEALAIAHLPIEILDLKEPDRGPLAPCDPGVWSEVLEKTPFSGKWSIALGESEAAVQVARFVPKEVDFVKMGPHQIQQAESLRELWGTLRLAVSGSTEIVAVAYADYDEAECLPPEQILDLASRDGLRTLLIDTFSKGGKTSLDWLGWQRVMRLITTAAQQQIEVVLAGGLSRSDLRSVGRLPVSKVAIRGAACPAGRTSEIDPELVEACLKALHGDRAKGLPSN